MTTDFRMMGRRMTSTNPGKATVKLRGACPDCNMDLYIFFRPLSDDRLQWAIAHEDQLQRGAPNIENLKWKTIGIPPSGLFLRDV